MDFWIEKVYYIWFAKSFSVLPFFSHCRKILYYFRLLLIVVGNLVGFVIVQSLAPLFFFFMTSYIILNVGYDYVVWFLVDT